MATIRESEQGMEQNLGILVETWLPQTAGFSLEVDIFEKGRKKRRDASSDSFRPGSSEIRIKFGGSLNQVAVRAGY
jgi:hypothetical protein